jgi:hypothetical protein
LSYPFQLANLREADNALATAPDQQFGTIFHGRPALRQIHPSTGMLRPSALAGLIAGGFVERVRISTLAEMENVPLSSDDRRQGRGDLAWAMTVGGIGTVVFATLVVLTW